MAWVESKSFNIFKNGNKQKETLPDYSGTILIPGELLQKMVDDFKESDDKFARVRFASWRASKANQEKNIVMSAKLSMNEEPRNAPKQETKVEEFEDDDIPF